MSLQRMHFRIKLFRGGPQKIYDFETRWIVVTLSAGHWGHHDIGSLKY